MVSLVDFPAVIIGGNTSIVGELYKINNETYLDIENLEGYPILYERIEIPTKFGEATMYVMEDPEDYEVIESGNWLKSEF